MTDQELAGEDASVAHERPLPASYLLFAFIAGFGICFAILHAGFERMSFLPAILIGGSALAVFRIIKRRWLDAIGFGDRLNKPEDSGWKASTVGLLAAIWVAMTLVAALWYAAGYGLGLLIRLL